MSDLLISAGECKLARKLLWLFQSNDRNVFLGAKAPLGLAHVNVNLNVNIKKFQNSFILLKVVSSG